MGELLFYNSIIVSVSLGVCAVLATIGAMILARNMFFLSSTSFRRFLELRFRPTALRYMEELEYLIEGYQQKARLLDEYAVTYSVVFNEAKWHNLILTMDLLSRAHRELCRLLEQGESKDALCLAEFLIAAGEELAPWKYRHINDEWSPLAEWEIQVHTTLRQVVKHLWAEVQRSRGIGISGGTSIEQTMKVLEKVRDGL